jgi:lipopolysaccharide export system permease protein
MNLVLALLVYMTYSNLLSIVQAWIAQSKLTIVAGLAVHLLMLVVLVLLFYRRLVVFSFFRIGQRAPTRSS